MTEKSPGSDPGGAANEARESSLKPFELIEAVEAELKATLLAYAGSMPLTLITMGKFALAAPGKVMSTQAARAAGTEDPGRPPLWPLLALLSCHAATGPERQDAWRQALPAAVAVEIAMVAADLIDEITDQDPSPFVAEYGAGQALNTGNLMLVMAQQVLLRSALGSGGEHALHALQALQDALVQAATGQHLDMLYDRMGADEVTLEMCVQMTDLKAGALMAGACRMGALMSGAGELVVDLLTRFGQELGSIAQIANDVQDVMPLEEGVDDSPERKTDLQLRKRTLPIMFALRDESDQPNAVQRKFRGEPTAVEFGDEELRQAVVAAGGVQFANLIAEVHRQNALDILEEIESLRPGARAILSILLPR
jgi:competence protein ComQ